MLIESLASFGKFFSKASFSPAFLIKVLTDAGKIIVKNFFQNVLIIEISDQNDSFHAKALPVQQWGHFDDKKFFHDLDRAMRTPFYLPTGGNPLAPQGFYGVPVYPVYDAHMKLFINNKESVHLFLEGRIGKTVGGFTTTKEGQEIIESEILKAVTSIMGGKVGKGLIVLARVDQNGGPYFLSDERTEAIGESELEPGKFIVPNYEAILDGLLLAKLEEAKSKGQRDGQCSLCMQQGNLVSFYSTTWPITLPTWYLPLSENARPKAKVQKSMADGVALCRDCYCHLNYGIGLFHELSKPLHYGVVREIFSPSNCVAPQRRKAISNISGADIYGSVIILPILDKVLEESKHWKKFVIGLSSLVGSDGQKDVPLNKYLSIVSGLEIVMPESLDDYFRLIFIYFNPERGDMPIRAYIEDVLPSSITMLLEVADSMRDYVEEASSLLRLSLRQSVIYCMVPWLLSKAYGGSYLWDNLEKVFHRKPIGLRRVIWNSARRLESLSPRYGNSKDIFWQISREVLFFLVFSEFLRRYNKKIAKGGDLYMDDWQNFLNSLNNNDWPKRFDSIFECGFSAGYLTRWFSNRYFMDTNKGDFLKDRVMTFGASLTPDVVVKNGIKMFQEYAKRLSMKISFKSKEEFIGSFLAEYYRLGGQIKKNKDDFMIGFWSGFNLYPTGKGRKNNDQNIINQEDDTDE